MGRNHLAHASGDAINAVLAAAGYNFRRLVELFPAQYPDRAPLNCPAQIDLKPGSSRTTEVVPQTFCVLQFNGQLHPLLGEI
jgi:hypothetical protein